MFDYKKCLIYQKVTGSKLFSKKCTKVNNSLADQSNSYPVVNYQLVAMAMDKKYQN